MLVNQDYPDVLSFCRKPLEGGFDCGVICLAVDYEEVFLRVWGCCDMLMAGGISFTLKEYTAVSQLVVDIMLDR